MSFKNALMEQLRDYNTDDAATYLVRELRKNGYRNFSFERFIDRVYISDAENSIVTFDVGSDKLGTDEHQIGIGTYEIKFIPQHDSLLIKTNILTEGAPEVDSYIENVNEAQFTIKNSFDMRNWTNKFIELLMKALEAAKLRWEKEAGVEEA